MEWQEKFLSRVEAYVVRIERAVEAATAVKPKPKSVKPRATPDYRAYFIPLIKAIPLDGQDILIPPEGMKVKQLQSSLSYYSRVDMGKSDECLKLSPTETSIGVRRLKRKKKDGTEDSQ